MQIAFNPLASGFELVLYDQVNGTEPDSSDLRENSPTDPREHSPTAGSAFIETNLLNLDAKF